MHISLSIFSRIANYVYVFTHKCVRLLQSVTIKLLSITLYTLILYYIVKGVLYGMFLMGLLFGLIVKMGTIQNKKNLEVIIFFFLFTPLFFMESHFSLLFGAIIQSYLFLMLSCYILLIILRKYY